MTKIILKRIILKVRRAKSRVRQRLIWNQSKRSHLSKNHLNTATVALITTPCRSSLHRVSQSLQPSPYLLRLKTKSSLLKRAWMTNTVKTIIIRTMKIFRQVFQTNRPLLGKSHLLNLRQWPSFSHLSKIQRKSPSTLRKRRISWCLTHIPQINTQMRTCLTKWTNKLHLQKLSLTQLKMARNRRRLAKKFP